MNRFRNSRKIMLFILNFTDVPGHENCPTNKLTENIKCSGTGSDAYCVETDKKFCREANFCPAPRWGQWEAWTDCTVTCGKAPRVR